MRSPLDLARGLRRRIRDRLRRRGPRVLDWVLTVFGLSVVAVALLSYFPPAVRLASQIGSGSRLMSVAATYFSPLRNPDVLLKSGLPVYDLRITPVAYRRVQESVEAARERGYMRREDHVWVDGVFMHDGRRYDVEVRVRGDLSPHWSGPKKSWRIKFTRQRVSDETDVQDDVYMDGMRQINLVVPKDRDYVLAPFVNSLMRDEGLLVPRDGWAVLRINGRLQGLYYQVEEFGIPFLAAGRRQEGPIVDQNGRSLHFEQYTRLGTPVASDARFDAASLRMDVTGAEAGAAQAVEVLLEHTRAPTPESFDRVRRIVDWPRYLAFRNITTLLNTNHVRFGSDNLKLYFDPSQGRFEPIPWDVHLTRMPVEPGTIDFFNSHGPDAIERATLVDPRARLERNRALWKLLRDGGNGLIASFDTMHRRIRPLAWSDPLSRPTNADNMDKLRSDFEHNVRRVHKVLSFSSANVAYRQQGPERVRIDVAALNFSGIRIDGLTIDAPYLEGRYDLYEDVDGNGSLGPGDSLVASAAARAGVLELRLPAPYVLPEVRYDGDFIDGRYWEYFEPYAGRRSFFLAGRLSGPAPPVADLKELFSSWPLPTIRLAARNAVTGEAMTSVTRSEDVELPSDEVGIVAYDDAAFFDLEAATLDRAEFLRAHPEFAAAGDSSGGVRLSGRVTLDRTVVVPEGIPLILEADTDLSLGPGVSLVAYGGLLAGGTPARPIRVHGDGSGRPWGTLAALRPPSAVVLRHVAATGGRGARVNGVLFSGALAVHGGDLRIEDSSVTGMAGEDGLNLKDGRLEMTGSVFSGNASDAVDLDFVVGTVQESVFDGNVNDGLDISGSRIAVRATRFADNGDKGFSVGEDSHPTVENSLFLGNVTGLASKDLSTVRVRRATFVENDSAVVANRKKPEFGPGSAVLEETVFARNGVVVSEDFFSRGGVDIRTSLLDEERGCESCWFARHVRFRAPRTGDYRLAAEAAAPVDVGIGRSPGVDGVLPPLPASDVGRNATAGGGS